MLQEFQIAENNLLENLFEILENIVTKHAIYLVTSRNNPSSNEYSFVLGPLDTCGNVLGLYDEEYGWPTQIMFEDVKSISDVAPSRRRHPFLFLNRKCVAVSIYNSEYQKIKELLKKNKRK
ncbi:MAG: hypothetical protein HeimC3_04970 [Candidatus Heimdallarchaeota archaeon LC_3]|nr:MAG: hypothetical protein HeimC3_04970 [Candidatus Heimdallarchaeota archaeon LC_3]